MQALAGDQNIEQNLAVGSYTGQNLAMGLYTSQDLAGGLNIGQDVSMHQYIEGITSEDDAGVRLTNIEGITSEDGAVVHVTNTDLVVAGMPRQKIENSFSGPKEGFKEDDNTRFVLLCVDGQISDIPIIFLIDSGASESFTSEKLVEENRLLLTKSQERLKIHLADGSVKSCNQCLK